MAEILSFKRERRTGSWVTATALALLSIAVMLIVILTVYGRIGQPQEALKSTRVVPPAIQVVDGDTVRANGTVFRLVGFDTPEKGSRAKCQSERNRAQRATDRLRQIVASEDLKLHRIACACRPGTEGTNRCNHGRLCARLTVSGRDVGSILIGEGLARPYVCSGVSCPPRRGWC
jgi:endonuclease YncB( thermonuclease family)